MLERLRALAPGLDFVRCRELSAQPADRAGSRRRRIFGGGLIAHGFATGRSMERG